MQNAFGVEISRYYIAAEQEVKNGTVNKTVIGFVSGKVGDVVFREMHGKKFVSASPKKYKISQSKLAKKGRANFAASVKFAVTVNSIPQLKDIWSKVKAEGTNSYHRIIKYHSER